MGNVETTGQVEQAEPEGIQPSAGEGQTKDIDLSASAPNHMPASESGVQQFLMQAVQEAPESSDRLEHAIHVEMHLLPEKAPSGEETTPLDDVPSRPTIPHSRGDSITAPNHGVDYSAHSARFHASQMDTTLPHYVPYHHISPLMGASEAAQTTAQPDDLDEETPRIQAYAKLEFEDGEFYMNTYSVELGRDLEAARLAFEWEQENSQFTQLKRRRTSASSEDGSPNSINTVREDGRHNGRTVISETGGILGPDAQESHIHKKPRLSESESATPFSPELSRTGSMDLQNATRAGQSAAMASLIDASNLPQANPEACPLIRIHPPSIGEGFPASHRGISRKHVKIAFNFKKLGFELTILGRNGAFVDESYYNEGDAIPLKNGSLIQIGGVRVRFVLPDMSSGEDSAEAADPFSNSPVDSSGALGFQNVHKLHHNLKVHGFTLENSPYQGSYVYSSSEENEPEGDQGEAVEAEGTEVDGGVEAEDDEDGIHMGSSQAENSSEPEELEAMPRPRTARAKQNGKPKTSAKQAKTNGARLSTTITTRPEVLSNAGLVPEPTAPVLKRKGPGRPPKNGVMSKREQKLLAKQAQEAAKATEPSASGERVIDADQNDTLAPLVPTKRKYTKRKPKDPDHQSGQDPGGENPEHTGPLPPRQASEAQPKPPKEKKSARPPRIASPVIDKTTLPKEQLLRPNTSYLHILHEVLSEAPPEGMGLPKIYAAIANKYKFFKYEVATVGWQSSVRHNLTQHEVFVKTKREGKGWLWALNPDIPLAKEKKRRVSSPPQSTQHASHHPQMMAIPENYQQAHMMHAPHNFPPPFPAHAHLDYSQPPMISHPYHHPGISIPNGYPTHNNIYAQFEPPGQLPYPPPAPSQPGMLMGSSHQGVPPNGLSLSLLKRVGDTSSTYESPYQPKPPTRPPDPLIQQAASAATLVNGFDGAHDHPGTVESGAPLPPAPLPPAPPAASEILTTQLNGAISSPAPQPQSLGSASASASNTSPEITQAIEQFQTSLVGSMKDHKHGEALVSSAINRVLGNQTSSSLPGNEEDPQEKTIMQIFSGMLHDLKKKSSQLQQPQPSQRAPSEPPNSQPQSSHVPVAGTVTSASSPTLQKQQHSPPSPPPQPSPPQQLSTEHQAIIASEPQDQ